MYNKLTGGTEFKVGTLLMVVNKGPLCVMGSLCSNFDRTFG